MQASELSSHNRKSTLAAQCFKIFAVLVFATFVSATQAIAERRLALVVGIDAYENVATLHKAVNDASAVSDALAGLGFDVTTLIDPIRRDLNRGIARFASSIRPGDEVVFFFAGHGIGIDGRNFLLPADVPAAEPGDAQFIISESIAADELSDQFQLQGARVAFLILDACRNNPFEGDGTRGFGLHRGLSRMDPAEGTFILFSAGTGQTALDRLSDRDENPNSVFTRALLPRLLEPGLSVHEMVQAVRSDVRKLASSVNHNQFPAYYDQLAGSFRFNVALKPTAHAPASSSDPLPADPCTAARADWAILESSESTAALHQFVATHIDCPIYLAAAQDRLAALKNPTFSPPARGEDTSCEGLWYARNLIYHQNGYCFQTKRAKTAFDVSSCTTRNPILSQEEVREVERLRALEKAKGC